MLELQQQELPLLVFQQLVQHLQQVQLLEFRPQEQRLQRLELHRENDRPSRHENVELLLRQQLQNLLQQRRQLPALRRLPEAMLPVQSLPLLEQAFTLRSSVSS